MLHIIKLSPTHNRPTKSFIIITTMIVCAMFFTTEGLAAQPENRIYLKAIAWSPSGDAIAYGVGGDICDGSATLYLIDSSDYLQWQYMGDYGWSYRSSSQHMDF